MWQTNCQESLVKDGERMVGETGQIWSLPRAWAHVEHIGNACYFGTFWGGFELIPSFAEILHSVQVAFFCSWRNYLRDTLWERTLSCAHESCRFKNYNNNLRIQRLCGCVQIMAWACWARLFYAVPKFSQRFEKTSLLSLVAFLNATIAMPVPQIRCIRHQSGAWKPIKHTVQRYALIFLACISLGWEEDSTQSI